MLFPLGSLIWIWLCCVGDLVFFKRGQSLRPCSPHTKGSATVIQKHSNSSWKTGKQCICFFLPSFFQSLTTNTQGEITIFFPSVCFSKVSSEVLPIWLRKIEAPVTNCVHNPLCGLEPFPTYRCYKKLMFFQGPTVCSSATDKEDRVMSEVLFVLWDDSCNKTSQQNAGLSLLCLPHPHPFWHLSPQAGFHSPSLTIPSLKSQTTRLFWKIQLHSIYSGSVFKGQGFWNTINKIISSGLH